MEGRKLAFSAIKKETRRNGKKKTAKGRVTTPLSCWDCSGFQLLGWYNCTPLSLSEVAVGSKSYGQPKADG